MSVLDLDMQSFQLRGRNYWIHRKSMDVLNYQYSYGVTREIAEKAVGWTIDPECEMAPLYLNYLEWVNGGRDPEEDKVYLRCKLWNIIDGSRGRISDILSAMNMLLEITVNKGGKGNFSHLSFDELMKLVQEIER